MSQTDNWFQNWVKDYAVNSAVDDVRKPGERNAGTISRILGAVSGTDVDKAVDINTVDQYLNSSDLTREELDMSGDVRNLGRAKTLTKNALEEQRIEKEEATRLRAYNDPFRVQERNTAAQDRTDQLELLRSQIAQGQTSAQNSYKLGLAQLANSSESNANQLEYMKLRDRKEDQRYNERMDKLDRKDRKAAMQQLGVGIAALAAAFAM